MPGLVGMAKKAMVSKPVMSAAKKVDNIGSFINNPGASINKGIAGAIQNPAKTVTSFVTDQIAGSLTSAPIIPGAGLVGGKIGNKIQSIIDGGKKSASLERAVKADKYLKSGFANKLEYGVNKTAMGLSRLSGMMPM